MCVPLTLQSARGAAASRPVLRWCQHCAELQGRSMLPLVTTVADIGQLPRGLVAGNSIAAAAADGELAVVAALLAIQLVAISTAAARCPGRPFPRTRDCSATAGGSPWLLLCPQILGIPRRHSLVAPSIVCRQRAEGAADVPTLRLLCLRRPCRVSKPRPRVRLAITASSCRSCTCSCTCTWLRLHAVEQLQLPAAAVVDIRIVYANDAVIVGGCRGRSIGLLPPAPGVVHARARNSWGCNCCPLRRCRSPVQVKRLLQWPCQRGT